jgi:hypothetical protein
VEFCVNFARRGLNIEEVFGLRVFEELTDINDELQNAERASRAICEPSEQRLGLSLYSAG